MIKIKTKIMAKNNGDLAEERSDEYDVNLSGSDAAEGRAEETQEERVDVEKLAKERAKEHPAENFISDFEMEAGIALTEEIRGKIEAVLLEAGDPRSALADLKSDLSKSPEEAMGAPVVQKIIDYYNKLGHAIEGPELSSIEDLDELKSSISDTLTDAILTASKTRDTREAKFSIRAALRIQELFAKLDHELESGYMTIELNDMQNWIDFFATALGFDEKVFGGVVKKYYALASGKSEETEKGPEKASV